jgi:hypothetical protein
MTTARRPLGVIPEAEARANLLRMAQPVGYSDRERAANELGVALDDWIAMSAYVARPGNKSILVIRGGKTACVRWIRKDYPGKPIYLKAKTDAKYGVLRVPSLTQGAGWKPTGVDESGLRALPGSSREGSDAGLVASLMQSLAKDANKRDAVYSAFANQDWVVFRISGAPLPRRFIKLRFSFLRTAGGVATVAPSSQWAFVNGRDDPWSVEMRSVLGDAEWENCLDGLVVSGTSPCKPYTSDYDIGGVIWFDQVVDTFTTLDETEVENRDTPHWKVKPHDDGELHMERIQNTLSESMAMYQMHLNQFLLASTRRRCARFLHGAQWNREDFWSLTEREGESVLVFLPSMDTLAGVPTNALRATVPSLEDGRELVRTLLDYARSVLHGRIQSVLQRG